MLPELCALTMSAIATALAPAMSARAIEYILMLTGVMQAIRSYILGGCDHATYRRADSCGSMRVHADVQTDRTDRTGAHSETKSRGLCFNFRWKKKKANSYYNFVVGST